MNEQLQTLLQESLLHFHKRNLKKALNTAQIALEFGLNEGADNKDLLEANIILARIYLINGRYQNEPSYWRKAIQYIKEAERLNELLSSPRASQKIAYVFGKVNLNLKDYQKAELNFTQSLQFGEVLNDLQGIVLSKLGICELNIARGELELAIEQGQAVLDFLEKNASPVHLQIWTEAYLQLSQAYIKNQNYSQSLEMSQQLLRLSRSAGDAEKEVLALRNIAVVCGVKSNYKIGMQYFLEALTKCEALGYRELLLQLHVNIGTIYAHLYNYPEAIKKYLLVLEEFEDVLEDRTRVVVFNNLGNIYLTTEHPEQALGYFEKAFSLAEDYQFQYMAAHSLAQLSRTKLQLNRFQEAVQETEWAEDVFEKLGRINGYQFHLLNKAEISFRKKDLEKAIEQANEAIEAARQLEDDACEIRGYKQLAKVYKSLKNYEKALEYQEKFTAIQDDFSRVQQSRQFLDMEIRHAIREKEKEIELLTKDNEYKALLLQKTDTISQKNEELMRANEDLKQFAYVASHDLKEPLRMIGSYAQLIHRKIGEYLDQDGVEYFGFIQEGVKRMNELLDGLLKYATVSNSQRKLEAIDLNRSLSVSIANLRSRIEETEAKIEEGKLPMVQGHHELMVQLFQNLLSNALKFQKAGQKPHIKIDTIETQAGSTIFIKDNGIGISPHNQRKIFEIFQRLHSKDNFEGTGIGLAICQKIAQRMNGRIWVESEEGKGATFYLTLPKE